MQSLRAKQRDRLHDAIAQIRDPPFYIVASCVDRANFYAVWHSIGRVICVAKGDHRDPLSRKKYLHMMTCVVPFSNAYDFAGAGPNGVEFCAILAQRYGIGQRTHWYRALRATWCAVLRFCTTTWFSIKICPKNVSFWPRFRYSLTNATLKPQRQTIDP